MFKLITKQGLWNLKNRWRLYLSYLLFCFFTFLIIFALFGFTLQFDQESHQIIKIENNPTYILKLFNFSFDESESKKIKEDEENHQDLWSFLNNQFAENSDDSERLRELVIKSGTQDGYLKNEDFDSTNSLDQKVQATINSYGTNFLIYWFYESKVFENFSTDQLTAFDSLIKLETENQGLVNLSTFKMDDFANNSDPSSNLQEWQKTDYLDEFYWLEKSDHFQENDNHQIVITPKFAQKHHLKIGDYLILKIDANQIKTLKVAGIAVKRSRALVDNSQEAFLNPTLYNQIIKNQPENWIQNLDIASPNEKLTKSEYDGFCLKQDKQYEETLSQYFDSLNQKPFGELKKFSLTTSGSLEVQTFTYYLLTVVICLILLGMLIVIYMIVSENNLQQQKEQILFLKSLGTNNHYLTYFILITILPLFLLVYFLAIGLVKFVYQLFCATLENSIGFNLPSLFVNNWPLIILIILLLFLILLISYFIVWTKIKKTLVQETNQTQNFSFKLIRQIKKVLLFQPVTISTTLKNSGKSIQLLIISFFTFLALGVTLQFTNAINHSAKSNQEFFSPYLSYSYQILKTGQVEYDSENTEQQWLKSGRFSELPRTDFSNSEKITDWFNQISNEDNLDSRYFNQTQDLVNPKTLQAIQEIEDLKVKNSLLKLYDFVITKLTLYHQYFGKNAPEPMINFKYLIFPDYYWLTTIFKTTINQQMVTSFADQRFDSQVSEDGVIVNYLLAKDNNLKVGDLIKINYLNPDAPQTPFQVEKKIEKIQTKINDNYQIILNSAVLNEWLVTKNALFSQNKIPTGLKVITMPVMKNQGKKLADYWDFDQEKWNDLNLNMASFPLLTQQIAHQSLPYTNLLFIISVFMIILSIIVLILIGLMFSLENQQQISIFKILGYRFTKVIEPIIWIFGFSLIVSWILANFVSIIIIQKSSHLLLNKILIELNPVYNFQTLGVNMLLAIMMLFFICCWIWILYKNSSVKTLK